MTDQFENHCGKDTISDEDWARVLGEAPEDNSVAAAKWLKESWPDPFSIPHFQLLQEG